MVFNLSPVFCIHNGVVILEQTEKNIVIGMLNIEDQLLKTKIQSRYEQYLRQKDGSQKHVCLHDNCIEYKNISKDYFIRKTSGAFARSQEYSLTHVSNETFCDTSSDVEQNLIEDAPIIHLLNSLLLECIERDGSDIHIEPAKSEYRVKMRALGDLQLYSILDTKTAEAVLLRILFLSGLDIDEKRRPQDGSFHFEVGSTACEIRVSVLPSQFGLSCVLRILSYKNFTLNFHDLGFSSCHINFLREACAKNNSLILVCGATGAGKSTTLAAMLHSLTCQQKKIITIEDPIEYYLDGVVQVPVNIKVDMDFPNVLRSTFRHDPDVIMIGEIRDEKTARIAVRCALTGHLVLASLHAVDAPSALVRLLDMGIESWLLASVFGGVFCQRLIRKHSDKELLYMPVAEALPSCVDLSALILKKASLYEYRDWMAENNIESMQKEELYATCI